MPQTAPCRARTRCQAPRLLTRWPPVVSPLDRSANPSTIQRASGKCAPRKITWAATVSDLGSLLGPGRMEADEMDDAATGDTAEAIQPAAITVRGRSPRSAMGDKHSVPCLSNCSSVSWVHSTPKSAPRRNAPGARLHVTTRESDVTPVAGTRRRFSVSEIASGGAGVSPLP